MKKINLNNLVNKFLVLFLIIQPIFDMKIFYNSISTLIRVIVIFTLFLYYFITSKDKRKYLLLIYPFLLCIYFVFHHFNALNFHSLVPGDFNYSMLKEMLYFVKMISPFLLIYSLYKAKFSNDTITKIIKYLVLIISLVIVVSNLLGFSYGNYGDSFIKANFFDWFNNKSQYTYYELASKGLFEYGNQIGAVLLMFLPFMINNALKKKNFSDWITLILNIFALILLCTRVSVLGVVLVFIYTLCSFAFIDIINKKRFKIKHYMPICIILLIYVCLLPFNPMFSRLKERQTVIENFENNNPSPEKPIIGNLDNIDIDMSEKIQFIEETYESKQLNKQFLFENYPYKYDPEFWYDFLQKDISFITDYRYIELSMVKRVTQINNNKFDILFGITNVRLQNIFNIEKDFVVQFYALRYYWYYINIRTLFYITWLFHI